MIVNHITDEAAVLLFLILFNHGIGCLKQRLKRNLRPEHENASRQQAVCQGNDSVVHDPLRKKCYSKQNQLDHNDESRNRYGWVMICAIDSI